VMDETDYLVVWVPEERGWRITDIANGNAGWVAADGDKFRARVMVDGHWMTIWSGNGLKNAVEHVIWYHQSMTAWGE
jgi:hypothetical protein